MSDRPTSEPVERGAGAPSCLFVLTYYAPYVSGLTQIAVQTAETLVRRGWRVTAVCTNHASLPAIEVVGGVRVRRARPLVSVSKGVISPGFLRLVRSEAREHDSVVVVALTCVRLNATRRP